MEWRKKDRRLALIKLAVLVGTMSEEAAYNAMRQLGEDPGTSSQSIRAAAVGLKEWRRHYGREAQ